MAAASSAAFCCCPIPKLAKIFSRLPGREEVCESWVLKRLFDNHSVLENLF
jgi:hypothetical protein